MLIKSHLLISLAGFVNILALGQNFEIFYNDETFTNQALIHATCLNDSTIIAVGAGAIVKTTDYGNTWVPYYFDGILNQITFPSDSIGYAVGYNSRVMKTVNQGETWGILNTDVISTAHTAFKVSFLNNDTGFVALANGPDFAFLTTYDGGETWENGEPGSVYGRGKLQKINDSTVYALPYGDRYYSSSDYGASWQDVLLPNSTGSSRDMYFFNKDTGMVAIREFSMDCGSNFYLARTEDGGMSWNTDFYECKSFREIQFVSNTIGFALSNSDLNGNRRMWRTLNSGISWELFQYPVGDTYFSTSCRASSLACVNQDTCYMPTNYGTIIKMTNATGGLVSTMQEEVKSSNKLQVYPNPNNGLFKVRLSHNEKITRIALYSMDGRKVYDDSFFTPNDEIQINASDVESGLYAITVYTTRKIHSGKFIKL